MDEDVPRRTEQGLARRLRPVDGGESQPVLRGDEHAEVLEALLAPGDGGEDLQGTHPAVLVEIEQLERPLFQLEALDGAAQGHPQLLIELVEVRQVLAILQSDLIEAAHPVEPELVCHRRSLPGKRLSPSPHFGEQANARCRA
jgi:hypothetical protein